MYTDELFCNSLNDYMRSINLNTWIDWSEQGMNLSDFCSFDLEKDHMY